MRFQKDCFWTVLRLLRSTKLLTLRRILSRWVQFLRFPSAQAFCGHNLGSISEKVTQRFPNASWDFNPKCAGKYGESWGLWVEMELMAKNWKKCYSAFNFARRAFCQSFFSFRLPLAESENCAAPACFTEEKSRRFRRAASWAAGEKRFQSIFCVWASCENKWVRLRTGCQTRW